MFDFLQKLFDATTHFMDIINLWTPAYWMTGSVKVMTALASAGTLIILPFYFKRIRDLARGAELLKTQEALRESEALYKQIVDTADEGIWLVDLEYRTKFTNQRMADMLGYTVEELKGRALYEFLDDKGRKDLIQNSLDRTGTTVGNHDFMMYCKDGSELYTRVACNPIYDKSGQMTGNLGMITNITRKRNAEEKLRLSEIHFRSLIEGVPQLIWSALTDGTCDYSNHNLCQHLGYTPKQVVEDVLEAVHVDERDSTRTLWKQAFTRGEPVECEYRLRRFDGEYRWQLGRIIPLRNASGVIVKWMGIATDIHGQKAALLAQYQHKLSEESALESSRLKSEFIANMSHEIRTPLNGVIGMMTLLAETPLSEEQRDYADSGRRSGEALLTVINDVLDFSKIEAGKLDLESIDFDLRALVKDTELSLSFTARSLGLSILTSVEPELPRYIQGDPGRIRQVLTNLLGNALKFTSEGFISLKVTGRNNPGSPLRFEVTDTGIGISEDGLKKLFDAFSQTDSSTTRKYGGTGLGLSISKHLVEKMGGEIGVESHVGMGSKFWFTLPLVIGRSQGMKKEVQSIQTAWPEARILVADDNAINRKVVMRFLASMGYQAQAVANGYEVLDALMLQPYDLILMDCHMPEMDGYECARQIRQNFAYHRAIPIVALTAGATKNDHDRCLASGMDAYVPKPIKREKLFDVIERLVERERLTRTEFSFIPKAGELILELGERK